MQELSQEQLLTAIDQAIDLYQSCQPIKGMLPSSGIILTLLQTCGIETDLKQVKICREIVIDRRAGSTVETALEEAVQSALIIQYGECVECERVAFLTENGYCEGCVMQAIIDSQSR